MVTRADRAYGYDDFLVLFFVDVGKDDLFHYTISRANKPGGEKRGLVSGRCIFINAHTETANGARLAIPLCDNHGLTGRDFNL